MYCSSCGVAVSPSLTYCNRCGAELIAKDRSPNNRSEAAQESLAWALAVVTIVGIGAVIGFMAVMKEVVHFNNGLIIAFSLLTFLAFLGVDSVIIWLLLRPMRDARKAYSIPQQTKLTTNELAESMPRVLPEPSFSVTDHTTHTLESADRKQQAE